MSPLSMTQRHGVAGTCNLAHHPIGSTWPLSMDRNPSFKLVRVATLPCHFRISIVGLVASIRLLLLANPSPFS